MAINKKYQIIRKDISSYQGHNFAALEKKHLEIIPEVQYSDEENPDLKKIYITNSNSTLEDLEQRDDLALIIHPNSGYDNYPVNFVKNVNCPIIVGNKIRMNAVVSYIMSALFSHTNKIPSSAEWDHSRKWSRTLLSERKILIIGNGHIGKRVELMLKTLSCSPRIYDPFKGHNDLDPTDVEIVIMACSLNPTSEKIVSKEFLSKLAPYYLFINAARGACVDQDALCDSLLSNKRAYAYLDVFEKEPFGKSQFIGIKNIELSSHVAGVHNSLNTSILNFEWNVINDFVHKCADLDEFKKKYADSILQNKISDDFLI
jgi:D-3-phosphoglycerate dehydrogenase